MVLVFDYKTLKGKLVIVLILDLPESTLLTLWALFL